MGKWGGGRLGGGWREGRKGPIQECQGIGYRPYASIQQVPLNSIIAAANSISSVASTTLARNVSLFTL